MYDAAARLFDLQAPNVGQLPGAGDPGAAAPPPPRCGCGVFVLSTIQSAGAIERRPPSTHPAFAAHAVHPPHAVFISPQVRESRWFDVPPAF